MGSQKEPGRDEPSFTSRPSRRITLPSRPKAYPAPARFDRELKRSGPIYQALAKATADMINSTRLGTPLEPELVEKPVADMIASVIRHPDAMVWQRKLSTQHQYLSGHAVRCAVLSTVLGRTLNLPEQHLEYLALGGLLCQIGKTKIHRKLLEKSTDLTPDDIEKIRQFIPLGVSLLESTPGIPGPVIEIVANHQERLDGSGYPNGRKGDEIPILARIVALADWYDAMTTRKPYTETVISATDAMDELYKQRDVLFQGQIVEAFIQGFGIYPCGNLVEMNTGAIALVEAQNRDNRTQPVVRLVTDRGKRRLARFETIDLRKYNADAPQVALTIKRALPDGEVDLDPNEIMSAPTTSRGGWLKSMFGKN